MSLFDAVADLPLVIEEYALDRLERDVSSSFTRVSTVVRLYGAGTEGVGEDVVYDAVPQPPQREVSRRYRHWTFESAALDLALRQASMPLHEAVGREPRPVRF